MRCYGARTGRDARQHTCCIVRGCTAPRDDLVRADQCKRRFIEFTQGRLRQPHDAQVHFQIAGRGFEGVGSRAIRAQREQCPFGVEQVEQRAPVIEPRVRWPAARTGGGCVGIRFVRRQHGSVAEDDGRSVVPAAVDVVPGTFDAAIQW